MTTKLLHFFGEGKGFTLGLEEYVTLIDTRNMSPDEIRDALTPEIGFSLKGVYDVLPDNSLVDSQPHELPLEEILAKF